MNRLAALLWQIYGMTGAVAESIFETLIGGYGLAAGALIMAVVATGLLLARKK